ncbi:MAG: bacteriohemerythrin [Rhodocyclaceae bacterium]|nr:bacteriohemerythrin [Rhodocyclaceae bacterium]
MTDRAESAPMAWDAAISTGVASLDEQHRSLFECLNLLEEAAVERSMLRTFHVMEQLSNYVHSHFAEEEFLMRMHDFPGLAGHMREHRSFTNRLHQLRKIYLDRDISRDLVVMLREWLTHHVAQTDMEYVPYLTAARRLDLGLPAVAANDSASLAHPAHAEALDRLPRFT